MTKNQALLAVLQLRHKYNGTARTTLGDLYTAIVDPRDFTALDKLRDSFANLTWDTTCDEAVSIIENEPEN